MEWAYLCCRTYISQVFIQKTLSFSLWTAEPTCSTTSCMLSWSCSSNIFPHHHFTIFDHWKNLQYLPCYSPMYDTSMILGAAKHFWYHLWSGKQNLNCPFQVFHSPQAIGATWQPHRHWWQNLLSMRFVIADYTNKIQCIQCNLWKWSDMISTTL